MVGGHPVSYLATLGPAHRPANREGRAAPGEEGAEHGDETQGEPGRERWAEATQRTARILSPNHRARQSVLHKTARSRTPKPLSRAPSSSWGLERHVSFMKPDRCAGPSARFAQLPPTGALFPQVQRPLVENPLLLQSNLGGQAAQVPQSPAQRTWVTRSPAPRLSLQHHQHALRAATWRFLCLTRTTRHTEEAHRGGEVGPVPKASCKNYKEKGTKHPTDKIGARM